MKRNLVRKQLKTNSREFRCNRLLDYGSLPSLDCFFPSVTCHSHMSLSQTRKSRNFSEDSEESELVELLRARPAQADERSHSECEKMPGVTTGFSFS